MPDATEVLLTTELLSCAGSPHDIAQGSAVHREQTTDMAPLRAAIAEQLRSDAGSRYLYRLNAALLVQLGHGCHEVAGWLHISPRTVERWTRAYEQAGVAALRESHGGGRPPGLSPDQMRQLSYELSLAPSLLGFGFSYWSGKLLAHHVAQRYGLAMSARHCQRLIKAGGIRKE